MWIKIGGNMNSIDEIKKKALEDHIPIIMDDTLETVGQILQEKKTY